MIKFINDSFAWIGEQMVSPEFVERAGISVQNPPSEEAIREAILWYKDKQYVNKDFQIPNFADNLEPACCVYPEGEEPEGGTLFDTYFDLWGDRVKDCPYVELMKGMDSMICLESDVDRSVINDLYEGTDFLCVDRWQLFATKIKINGKLVRVISEHADGGWNAWYFSSKQVKQCG